MPIGQIIGAAAGPVTSIVGGFLQRSAAKRAAEQQAAAALAAKKELMDTANTSATGIRDAGTQGRSDILATLGYNDPYSAAGEKATGQVSDLTSQPENKFSFDPSSLGMDPGYLFRQKEANKTMLQNGAAFGNLQSGGFAKAFQDRNQEAASQEADKVYGRQLQTFNTNQGVDQSRIANLLSIMGFGQKANEDRTAGTESASGLNVGAQENAGGLLTDAEKTAASLTTGAGTAQAVGTINAGNQTAGILGNVGKALTNINWSDIFKKKPATGGPSSYATPSYAGAGLNV